MRALLLFALLLTLGYAQAFPTRPVRVIMPFPAGGPSDVMMRAIAEELAKQWGQPVLIDNRPGANTLIGAEAAAKMPPDGHGLLYATAAAMSISPVLYRKIPVDPEKDFVPVTQLASSTNFLMVSSALPARTLREFVDFARGNPGKIDYGSMGIGSTGHLDTVALERAAAIQLNHIPFKGAGPVIPEMIAGRLHMFFSSVGTLVVPALKDGKIRLLAVADTQRSELYPEVPTFREQGIDLVTGTWLGLVAPAGTPREIVAKVSADVARIVRDPAFEAKHVRSQGLKSVGSSPAEFGEYLKRNRAYWAEAVKASGVKLDL
jgi:tripartite-type tricarboxylate transporter receptor subunit TctC